MLSTVSRLFQTNKLKRLYVLQLPIRLRLLIRNRPVWFCCWENITGNYGSWWRKHLKKSYRRLLMKQPKRKSTNLFWLATELYFSMKIKQLWKVYKKLFPCIRINFRNGLNIRRLCISLSYGLCWKMPDSGLLCNITIL